MARKWALRIVLSGMALYGLSVAAFALDHDLAVPVEGVRSSRLVSTFGAPRGGGTRRHEGVDIFARRGTRVRSAGYGVVIFTGELPLGGNVVYAIGEGATLCYYAHLDRTLVEVGDLLSRGTIVGTVGNTGNARTTRAHLHFEARPAALLFRAIDPVDLLRASPPPSLALEVALGEAERWNGQRRR